MRLISARMLFGTLVLCHLACASAFASVPPPLREDILRTHVYALASDTMAGRKAGSPDGLKAACYIASQYENAGLEPVFRDGMLMPFGYPQGSHPYYSTDSLPFRNVVAVIRGSDPQLRDEYILLGAHYDHLGIMDGKTYNGADDNASGSAALIEIARALSQRSRELRRSVIIAAFDAEEQGLFGSDALAEGLSDLDIRLMMSIDMVGWLRASGKLTIEGVGTLRHARELLASAAPSYGLSLSMKGTERSAGTATDTRGFAVRSVPTLAVSTGLRSPYHQPEDDADLIDYDGLGKVTGYLTDVTLSAAASDFLSPSGRLSAKHRPIGALRWGLSLSAGASSLKFPDAGFRGADVLAGSAGVSAQVGVNHAGTLALRASALVSSFGSGMPDEECLYGSAESFRDWSFTVPVCLVVQEPEDGLVFAGAGVYFSRLLCNSLQHGREASSSQFGACISLGVSVSRLVSISYQRFFQLGRYLRSDDIPSSVMRSGMLGVTVWY